MATVTQGYTWTSGEAVTPTKLNSAASPTVTVADGEVTTAKIADAAVTDAKLAATLNLSSKTVTLPATISLPAGAIMPFAMNSAPSGWLAANGGNVSRTTYSALFAAIGATYGAGDGSTTFALPDLRGYFVRGSGTNGDGISSGAFGAKQADAIKIHTHAISFGFTPAKPTASAFTTGGGGTSINGAEAAGSNEVANTLATSAGLDTETRPRNIAMLYCIKF